MKSVEAATENDVIGAGQLSRRRFAQVAGVGAGGMLLGARSNRTFAQSASGKVRFFMVAGASEEPAWRAMVDAFNDKKTGIEIDFELMLGNWDEWYRKLRGYLAAGDSPDLVRHMATGLDTWATSGELEDLNPYIQRDNFALDSFFEAAIQGLSSDGKQWGMPPGIYTAAWYFNRQLFRDAGIEPPTDWSNPWTIDELKTNLAAMTSGEGPGKKYGMSVSMDQFMVLPWIWSNGGDVINADGTQSVINQAPAVESLQLQRDLILDSKVAPTPTDTQTVPANELFATGRIAVLEGGPWLIPSMEESGIDWGVMPVAKGSSDIKTVQLIDFYAIQSAGKNKDAAWEVLKFFVSAEAEQILADHGIGGIPARKEVAQQNADDIFKQNGQVWMQSEDFARSPNLIQSYAEAMDIYAKEMDLVKLDQKTVQDAADDVATGIDALIAEDQKS